MSNPYLTSLSENATRLGQRLQESFSEHTRDLSIVQVGSGAGYLDAATLGEDKLKNLKKQLDGSSEREKLDALKRLVALISKGRNVSEHFPSVVKNVVSPNLEIRKLVYIYLLKYAEQEPDLALLSINSFQKDLADPSPLIRAMALRVLSGIRVPMIGGIVVLGIKKCAGDPSPYVRKTAGLAVPRCFELDSAHLPALIEIIITLLRDRSPVSLGSAFVAFDAVCPTRLDLLHPHFRRICKLLVEVDEWGQVVIMNVLLRYVRIMLRHPPGREREGYDEDPPGDEEDEGQKDMDKDLRLLLDSVELTLHSRNPAVVVAATKLLFYAGPRSYWSKFVNPLLRLLTVSREVERVVLVDLLIISSKAPDLFAPYYTRFLVRSDDMLGVKKDKIQMLLRILALDNWNVILREFIDYADDVNDSVAADAVHGLGRCAAKIPESVQQCLTALVTMLKSPYDAVVSSAVLVLKHLVQTQLSMPSSIAFASSSQTPLSIIGHLARKIDDIRHAQARACVIWLVGQYSASDEKGPGPEGIAEWAPDVLRKLAKTFGEEAPLVKLQVETLAAKLFVLSPNDRTIGLLSRYVFSLARYDLNYDVRDRGRMLSALLNGVGLQVNGSEMEKKGVVLRREQVRVVLFEGKAGVVQNDANFLDDEKVQVGSLDRVTGRPGRMEDVLPDWLERGVESSVRDSDYDAPPVSFPSVQSLVVLTPAGSSRPESRTGGKVPFKDLDAFYAEESESESEAESEAEESGSEEEGTGSSDDVSEEGV